MSDGELHIPALEHTCAEMLKQIEGTAAAREGLKETPHRFAVACTEWFGGYKQDPVKVLKAFTDGASSTTGLIFQANIPLWSHCEHHIAPFFGVCHIGYIPSASSPRIVGLSKFKRIVDVFARRLQVQERITNQIADLLFNELNPLGVGVVTACRHSCMESRGVKCSGTVTQVSELRGCIDTEASSRAEFMNFVLSSKQDSL